MDFSNCTTDELEDTFTTLAIEADLIDPESCDPGELAYICAMHPELKDMFLELIARYENE